MHLNKTYSKLFADTITMNSTQTIILSLCLTLYNLILSLELEPCISQAS